MRVSVSLSDRERHDWRNQASCLEMDPREFDEAGTPLAWNACRTCPVKLECLLDANAADNPPTHDVYRGGRAFGTSANQYRPRPWEDAKCGTDSGYYRHRRVLREPSCVACMAAHREATAKRKAREGA